MKMELSRTIATFKAWFLGLGPYIRYRILAIPMSFS